MYWQKVDLSNDVSVMKIVFVVCDSQLERQNVVFAPRMRDSFKLFLQKVML